MFGNGGHIKIWLTYFEMVNILVDFGHLGYVKALLGLFWRSVGNTVEMVDKYWGCLGKILRVLDVMVDFGKSLISRLLHKH